MGQEEGIFMKNFIVIFGLLLLTLFFISVGIGMIVEKNNDEDDGEVMFTDDNTLALIATLPFGLALCSFGFFVEQIIHLIF